MYRKIDNAEFDRDWVDVRTRVFLGYPGRVDGEDPFFVDPSWQTVPIPFTPFYDNDPGPERPEEFPPIEPYFKCYYEPLFRTLADFGVDEIVVSRRFGDGDNGPDGRDMGWKKHYGPDEASFVLSARLESFNDLRFGVFKTNVIFAVSGHDANWGLVCDGDEFMCSQLGGTPEFLARFFHHAGGERNVRAWFYYFHLAGGSAVLPALPEEDPDDDERRWLENMYRLAGWPPPYCWRLPIGGLIDWSWMFGDGASKG